MPRLLLYVIRAYEQMVHNFLRGGAAINALSPVAVTDLVIVDVGVGGELPEHPSLLRRKVARGTRNMLEAPATLPAVLLLASAKLA
jgi:nicotinate-nucleotide--dimethylbenzimidazole phosphoribosyltransferase